MSKHDKHGNPPSKNDSGFGDGFEDTFGQDADRDLTDEFGEADEDGGRGFGIGREIKIGLAVIVILLVVLGTVLAMRLRRPASSTDQVADAKAANENKAPTKQAAPTPNAKGVPVVVSAKSDSRGTAPAAASFDDPSWSFASDAPKDAKAKNSLSLMPKTGPSDTSRAADSAGTSRSRTSWGTANTDESNSTAPGQATTFPSGFSRPAAPGVAAAPPARSAADAQRPLGQASTAGATFGGDSPRGSELANPFRTQATLGEPATAADPRGASASAATTASGGGSLYRRFGSDSQPAAAPTTASVGASRSAATASGFDPMAPLGQESGRGAWGTADDSRRTPASAVSEASRLGTPEPAANSTYPSRAGFSGSTGDLRSQAASDGSMSAPRYGSAGGQAAATLGSRDGGMVRSDGTYTVEPNESFYSVAVKLYGTGTYYRALMKHNEKQYPSGLLKPGDTIVAPRAEELAAAYPALCPMPSHRDEIERRSAVTLPSNAAPGARRYVVQEGDTLYDIARHELGKAHRWAEIYELNRALIGKQFDYLTPGMQLILPDSSSNSGNVTQRPPLGYLR